MDLTSMFEPKSMAVVGISQTNELHPANVIYNKNRLRYITDVFPVNPKGGRLQRREIYPRITDIPQKVDLAVIAVRADQAPGVIQDCIEAGVKGAVVISGGFAESGRKDLQDIMADMAREADFPFIGPNCLGIFCPGKVDTFFLPTERVIQPGPGKVALVSQSGGMLVDQLINFAKENVGTSVSVSIGNKAVVTEIDLLRYLTGRPDVGVMAFYVEGFDRNGGRDFVLASRQCAKPVIVMKSGKSPEGSRAVSSHTASLAGDYEVFSQVMAQYGIVEARSQFELVSFCDALSCFEKPIEGRVAIVTISGGHGAMAVDACRTHGLTVPSLSPEFQEQIRQALSPSIRAIANLENPLDLTGSVLDVDFIVVAELLSRSPEIDCIIFLILPYAPGTTSDLGARLGRAYMREGKPMVAYVPRIERYRMLIEGFELHHIPVSPAIEGAVLMAEALRRHRTC